MRRLILKWLFKFPCPQYFEAEQYYKNIQWVVRKDDDSYKHYNVNNFYISVSELSGKKMWGFRNGNDPNDQGGVVWSYSEIILKIHDMIHFGIIMPKTKE